MYTQKRKTTTAAIDPCTLNRDKSRTYQENPASAPRHASPVTTAPTQTQLIIFYRVKDPSNAVSFQARITINFVSTPLATACAAASFNGTQEVPLS